MSRIIKEPNIDDLIQRYLAGESVDELARKNDISVQSIYRRFKKNGIPLRGPRLDIPNIDAYISRYLAGESENALSRELGVAREVLRRRLIENGVTPRSRSRGMTARWALATPEDKSAMLTNAHIASTGRKATVAERISQAITREKNLSNADISEHILSEFLAALEYTVTLQKAVGIYNLDIALNEFPLAVECFGGGWHSSSRHLARFHERTKYLLDSGWHILIVWIDSRRYPLSVGCAQYIHSLIQELSSNPPVRCQYRVILGNGETAPIQSSYLNTPSDIERFGHSVDSAGR